LLNLEEHIFLSVQQQTGETSENYPTKIIRAATNLGPARWAKSKQRNCKVYGSHDVPGALRGAGLPILFRRTSSRTTASVQLPVHGNKITLAHKYATILRTSCKLLVASAANSFAATPPGH